MAAMGTHFRSNRRGSEEHKRQILHATPECCLTPYGCVSGPGKVILLHTNTNTNTSFRTSTYGHACMHACKAGIPCTYSDAPKNYQGTSYSEVPKN